MHNMIDNFLFSSPVLRCVIFLILFSFSFFHHFCFVFQPVNELCRLLHMFQVIYNPLLHYYEIHKFVVRRHLATTTTTLIHTIFPMCIIFINIGAQRLVYAFNATEFWKERQPREEWVHWLEVVCVCFFFFSCFSHLGFRRKKLIRCPLLHVLGGFHFHFILWMSAIWENSTNGYFFSVSLSFENILANGNRALIKWRHD